MRFPKLSKALLLMTLPVGLTLATLLEFQKPAVAGDCLSYMGTAVTGARVTLDTCSINPVSARSTNFTYYLGKTKLNAQAHCLDGTWLTFHDHVEHRPQSGATEDMLAAVCGDNGGLSHANTALVFAPPSNVRVSQNGAVLCTLKSRMTINTYGSQGDWFYTDACGSMGLIHRSQLRF